ncbi:MAG: hypothetical protein KDD62_08940 [Bdellovibrionales bacterium]|nr:hypothetical protein [Bdellovibrionales bacterium]
MVVYMFDLVIFLWLIAFLVPYVPYFARIDIFSNRLLFLRRWNDVSWHIWEYLIPLLAPATLILTQGVPILAKGGMSNFFVNSFIMNLVASIVTWSFVKLRAQRNVTPRLGLFLIPILAAIIVKLAVPVLPD